jgi:hypothetical protein
MTILANDNDRRTNGQAIHDLATLGFLRKEDEVLDLTVGPNAGFWTRWQPDRLTTNARDPEVMAHFHVDASQAITQFGRKTFDVVVWDPDYGYRGTSALESDANYGLAGPYRTPDDVDRVLIDGMLQSFQIARRYVLVKCQDSCVASKFRDQSGFVTEAARAAGATVAGKLYVHALRAQPAGKKQLNIWGYHSVLLVIAVP